MSTVKEGALVLKRLDNCGGWNRRIGVAAGHAEDKSGEGQSALRSECTGESAGLLEESVILIHPRAGFDRLLRRLVEHRFVHRTIHAVDRLAFLVRKQAHPEDGLVVALHKTRHQLEIFLFEGAHVGLGVFEEIVRVARIGPLDRRCHALEEDRPAQHT